MPQNSEHNSYTTMSTTKIPATEDLQHKTYISKRTTENVDHKRTTRNIHHRTQNNTLTTNKNVQQETYNTILTIKIPTTQYLQQKYLQLNTYSKNTYNTIPSP